MRPATGKHYIVWQEIFDNGLDIDKHTIVDVWKGGNWEPELASVTAKGFQAIVRSVCDRVCERVPGVFVLVWDGVACVSHTC